MEDMIRATHQDECLVVSWRQFQPLSIAPGQKVLVTSNRQ
jgi:hypothetical protein